MNNDRVQAEQMKFLFISNPNTFATYTYGVPLKSCVYIFIALVLLFGLILAFAFPPIFKGFAFIESIVWLIMLAGPITENSYLCWVLTVIISILTFVEVFLKLVVSLVIATAVLNDKSIMLLLIILIHLILWFAAVYVYFSFAKSLGLGLIPRDVSQNNSQCMVLIQANEQNCQIPATTLRVDQSPTIALTNPVDLAFISDKQGLFVSGATLPSGLVVPSGGHGKNWKVVGNSITLV
jgi:hypothetical protein